MQSNTTQSKWVTPKQAAIYCNVGVSSLAKERMNGTGPAYTRLGAGGLKILYNVDDLDAWLKSKRVDDASQHSA